jgi:hypothetical protein
MTWTIHQKRFFKWIIEECRLPHELILLVIPKMIIDIKKLFPPRTPSGCYIINIDIPSRDYGVYIGNALIYSSETVNECIDFLDNRPARFPCYNYYTEIDVVIDKKSEF